MKMFLRKEVFIFVLFVAFFIGLRPSNLFALPSGSVPISRTSSANTAGTSPAATINGEKLVTDHLLNLGLTKEEINDRLSSLSEEQLNLLSQRLDLLQKGSSGWAVFFIVVGVVGIIMLILQATGKTFHIESKTQPQ